MPQNFLGFNIIKIKCTAIKSIKLYQQLEKDFVKPGLTDDWFQYMSSVADFLTDNFKKRSMGLVCDFNVEIKRVFTAVFPSEKVMQEILNNNEKNALLFVHHPSIWDIRNAPDIFYQMDRKLLEKFKERKISIFNLHIPLDNYNEYSPSVSLAKALGVAIEKPFANYFESGALCGVFANTKIATVPALKKKFESVLGHESRLYQYGDKKIKGGIVAIAAGGANIRNIIEEVKKEGVNTFITGISAKNTHSLKAHKFAKKNKINILGGTHYSTEKFACMAMCDYFKNFGLPAKFIEDKPILEDL